MCSSTNCSWTKFYQFTRLAKPKPRKCDFTRKLSQKQIDSIQNHMEGDKVTFPLPEAKYSGKHFFRISVFCAQKMYSMPPTTTCKISLSTYYQYSPKKFHLQGKILFRQSCCEYCQNFEAVTDEMSKYMIGILRTLADCIDSSMCPYNSYFPKMDCVLRICKNCGTLKLKAKLKKDNKGKMKDCRKQFLVKQWSTKSLLKMVKEAVIWHGTI